MRAGGGNIKLTFKVRFVFSLGVSSISSGMARRLTGPGDCDIGSPCDIAIEQALLLGSPARPRSCADDGRSL
jgi:hypothetical protein